jgi:outer membrane protein
MVLINPYVIKRYNLIMKKQFILFLTISSIIYASELDLGIGIGNIYYPDYLGSNHSNNLVVPFPFIDYHSEKLDIDTDGIKQQLFSIEGLSVRLSMSGSLPMSSSGTREGMDDLDPAGEIGPALVYSLYNDEAFSFKLDLPIRAVVSSDFKGIDYRGYLYEFKAKIEYKNKQGYLFQLHTGGVWADKRYNNYIYGVGQENITATREYYKAEAGYSGYKTSFGISKKFDKVWAGVYIRHYDLTDAIFGDSPLKERNSAIYGGAFVAYLFNKSFSNKIKEWIE